MGRNRNSIWTDAFEGGEGGNYPLGLANHSLEERPLFLVFEMEITHQEKLLSHAVYNFDLTFFITLSIVLFNIVLLSIFIWE